MSREKSYETTTALDSPALRALAAPHPPKIRAQSEREAIQVIVNPGVN
jgi:hypothetical protein